MLNFAKTFLDDDSGAVSVDHVVLTAGMVGLGLAAIGSLSPGLSTVSQSVSNQTGSQLISTSFFSSATSALSATHVFGVAEIFTDLAGSKQFSFKMDATVSPGDEGILFETGGPGSGTILYQHDGKIYLQAGSGGAAGYAANRGEAIWDVTAGSHTIEGSLDAHTGLALYVDGELVSQSSFQHSGLAGGNPGAVGDSAGHTAANRGGFVRGDTHVGAGELTVFADQTTGGEVP